MNNIGIDKNSRPYLNRKLATARNNLLIVVIFTIINLVLLLTESGRYFLVSASVPYDLTFLGAYMNYEETGAIMGTYTYTALFLSALILGLYVLCWALSKKRPVWYTVAAVLFGLDTLYLVVINMEYISDYIIDIVFHAWVLVELIQAVAAGKKLAALPPEEAEEEAAAPQPVPAAPAVEPWERKDLE